MKRGRWIPAGTIACLVLSSCGSSAEINSVRDAATTDGATSDGGPETRPDAALPEVGFTDEQKKAYCDARATCSPLSCADEAVCVFAQMLPTAQTGYLEAISSPSCRSGDAAADAAGEAASGVDATIYVRDCSTRRSACGNVFAGELCGPSVLAFANGKSEATACLAGPCEQVGACFERSTEMRVRAACAEKY